MAGVVSSRELVAEYAVLALHDVERARGRYDYGAGQRTAELRRRRLFLRERGAAELVELPPAELAHELEPAELLAAFERVGIPRMRRAGRMRSAAWDAVLYRLATVYGVEPLLLHDREELERENGHAVHVEVALEVYRDRKGI